MTCAGALQGAERAYGFYDIWASPRTGHTHEFGCRRAADTSPSRRKRQGATVVPTRALCGPQGRRGLLGYGRWALHCRPMPTARPGSTQQAGRQHLRGPAVTGKSPPTMSWPPSPLSRTKPPSWRVEVTRAPRCSTRSSPAARRTTIRCSSAERYLMAKARASSASTPSSTPTGRPSTIRIWSSTGTQRPTPSRSSSNGPR